MDETGASKARQQRRIRELEEANERLLARAREQQELLGRVEGWAVRWKSRLFLTLVILTAGAILLSFYPSAVPYAQRVFNPTNIPREYDQVSTYVTRSGAGARVAWIPFYKFDGRYSWSKDKRIGPFNIYSYNANLNNIIDVYNKNSYYYWFDNLYQQNPYVDVKLMSEQIMLGNDLAARLLIPCSAKYMIFDPTRPGYELNNPFEKDRSLRLVYQAGLLKVYRLKYTPDLVRVAGRTIKADSFFDNLSLSRKYPAQTLGSLSFLNGPSSLDERYGLVDIDKYKVSTDPDPGFEVWNMKEGYLHWKPKKNPRIQLIADSIVKVEGNTSLRVVNNSTARNDLGWVTGTAVPVTEGQVMSLESNIKQRNANWTSVSVEGFDRFTRSWKLIALCPTIQSGTSEWRKFNCSFYVPTSITMVRPVLAAGWAAEQGKGPGVSWFDNVKLSRIDDSFSTALDGAGDVAQVSFTRMSAEKYKVHVKNATSPFVLVFGEAYDPLWKVSVGDGKSVSPIKLYSLINGFPIDKTGTYDLTITYIPQTWFIQGSVVSVVTLLLCVAILLYIWKRRGRQPVERAPRTGGKLGASLGKVTDGLRSRIEMPPKHARTGRRHPHSGRPSRPGSKKDEPRRGAG